MRSNTFADGLFHLATYGFTIAGLVFLWRAYQHGRVGTGEPTPLWHVPVPMVAGTIFGRAVVPEVVQRTATFSPSVAATPCPTAASWMSARWITEPPEAHAWKARVSCPTKKSHQTARAYAPAATAPLSAPSNFSVRTVSEHSQSSGVSLNNSVLFRHPGG
mgnify:CR=1 FL=1